jgi:hypothetical protein
MHEVLKSVFSTGRLSDISITGSPHAAQPRPSNVIAALIDDSILATLRD